ncbi:MAG: hypothetical protein H6R15_2232 [Proteobacteria bacterium]|nr:hypothetical protein [Pseudomonadota bacterium]
MPTPHPAVSLPISAGLGLRAPHLRQVRQEMPAIAWFEVHSENYFVSGGPALAVLEEIRQNYPLSLHGVGMSLGGADDLDRDHLRQLKALAARIQPAAISEHLCWSAIGGRWLNDLLPLPYTREALDQVCRHVEQVQETLGRAILVENVSSYLRFLPEEMPEWTFVAEVAKRTGCGVLLDVNNIHVSACNHGFSAADFLAGIAVGSVGEIHLAGYEEVDGLLVDTHSRPVYPAVWELYRAALERFGPLPTLIEWDQDIPSLDILQGEAATAQNYLDTVTEARHVRAA